jgi:hypothetical protein
MRKLIRVVLTTVGSLALLAGVGWLGLQVKPKPFLPSRQNTQQDSSTAELPPHLPEPVGRNLRATAGARLPKIQTAVVWGRGEFNFFGLVWFPMRYVAYYDIPKREFRREIELTWFGMPVFGGYDAYVGGKGILKFGGLLGLLNVSDSGAKTDQGDNMAMWGELLGYAPSASVLDQEVHWESIDPTSSRLVFPLGHGEDSLRVQFDPESGLIEHVSGMRYRDDEETKAPWRGENQGGWKTVHGIKMARRSVGRWEDWEEPYIILDLEGVQYNVDVSEKLR